MQIIDKVKSICNYEEREVDMPIIQIYVIENKSNKQIDRHTNICKILDEPEPIISEVKREITSHTVSGNRFINEILFMKV